MIDFKPLLAILNAIEVNISEKNLKLIIEAYEAFKDKGTQLTIEQILKLKEQ